MIRSEQAEMAVELYFLTQTDITRGYSIAMAATKGGVEPSLCRQQPSEAVFALQCGHQIHEWIHRVRVKSASGV